MAECLTGFASEAEMRKTLIAAASGLALAVGSIGMSTPAAADPVLIPALVAAGIGGLGIGALAATAPRHTETVVVPARQEYYAPPGTGTVTAVPAAEQQGPCYWTRARVSGVVRRVQVCD
jgi:hypothetical protein